MEGGGGERVIQASQDEADNVGMENWDSNTVV